jgi:dinuclear metal center YbgI/SA1388 family protein
LVTHHPLIFSPLKQLNMGTYPGNVIVEAVHNGVSVIAVHTNLDVAKGGINDILVDLLGLRQAEVLKEVDGVHGVGLGRIGYLSEPAGVTGVLEKVKQILGTQRPKLVGAEDARVHRVAVVGGAGGSLVPLAFRREADLLLTGDVTHHQALEAQLLGLAVIDAGHYYTERTAFEVFAERLGQTLKERGWKVETAMDGEEGDPLKDMGMQDGSPG